MLALGETATSARTGSLGVTTLDTSLSLPSHVVPQLPLELLQRTFLALVGLYRGETVRSWGRPNWIEITYVCRYWRSAALDVRELWSSITPELSIAWSQAMIERSSPLPMSITILVNDASGPVDPYGLNSLAASELLSTSRIIRTLGLLGPPADVLNILNRLCRPSLLESFTLKLITVGDPVIDLPESLFGGDAPHLRRLTFRSDAYIRMPPRLLANITHFTDDICVSLDRLIESLEAMPQLEVLYIVRTFDKRDPTVEYESYEDLPMLPRTKLPRLSLLSIRDCFPNSFLLLSSWIDGPPTLRRHFFWQDDLDVLTEVSWSLSNLLLPFIPSESAPGANDGGLQIAQICGHKSDSLEMRSRTYSENASTAAREDALFLLKIEWSGRDPFHCCFPHPALFFSDFPTIEDLTIAQETGLDGAGTPSIHKTDLLKIVMEWVELLSTMPSVKTLRLHSGTFACVSVLLALGVSQDSNFSHLQVLEHLQRIIITNSAVHSAAPARPDGVGEAGAGSSVTGRKFVLANVGPQLMEVVNMRSGLEVVLAGCEVEAEMLDALRKRARVFIGHERVDV